VGIILSTDGELEVARRRAREEGLSIVMTCGVFDLLHIGHLSFLEEAKRIGDLLFVAVNSDLSFSRLGKERSLIISGAERVRMVAAFEVVDYAFLFDEFSAVDSIGKLRPDVFAKGPEYSSREFIERKVAESLGIKVEIVSHEFHSIHTTSRVKALSLR